MKFLPVFCFFLSLLVVAPMSTMGATSSRPTCAPKKKGNNRRNTNNHNRNTNNRNTTSKPRIVGKRTGNLPPLSSKGPKNVQTKPYEPPAHVSTMAQDMKTFKPKQVRTIRIVGRVQTAVETRVDKYTGERVDAEGYSIETSVGEVLLTSQALQRGGQIIDLRPYVGHRIRVTGDGYFKDERAKEGLRFDAIRRIETE